MKCILCNKRKAKRSCPAKDGFICAQCCGEKRVLELDCPETCPFLIVGRERASADFGKLMQSQDTLQQEKYRRILKENKDVIAHLEYTIAQLRLSLRDLTDSDVSGGIDMLLDVYKTEDKGILYEQDSDDLLVESVRRELREVLEAYRYPEGKEAQGTVGPDHIRLRLQNAIESLELIKFMIDMYPKNRSSGGSYVGFLARMTPRKESKSSIILP